MAFSGTESPIGTCSSHESLTKKARTEPATPLEEAEHAIHYCISALLLKTSYKDPSLILDIMKVFIEKLHDSYKKGWIKTPEDLTTPPSPYMQFLFKVLQGILQNRVHATYASQEPSQGITVRQSKAEIKQALKKYDCLFKSAQIKEDYLDVLFENFKKEAKEIRYHNEKNKDLNLRLDHIEKAFLERGKSLYNDLAYTLLLAPLVKPSDAFLRHMLRTTPPPLSQVETEKIKEAYAIAISQFELNHTTIQKAQEIITNIIRKKEAVQEIAPESAQISTEQRTQLDRIISLYEQLELETMRKILTLLKKADADSQVHAFGQELQDVIADEDGKCPLGYSRRAKSGIETCHGIDQNSLLQKISVLMKEELQGYIVSYIELKLNMLDPDGSGSYIGDDFKGLPKEKIQEKRRIMKMTNLDLARDQHSVVLAENILRRHYRISCQEVDAIGAYEYVKNMLQSRQNQKELIAKIADLMHPQTLIKVLKATSAAEITEAQQIGYGNGDPIWESAIDAPKSSPEFLRNDMFCLKILIDAGICEFIETGAQIQLSLTDRHSPEHFLDPLNLDRIHRHLIFLGLTAESPYLYKQQALQAILETPEPERITMLQALKINEVRILLKIATIENRITERNELLEFLIFDAIESENQDLLKILRSDYPEILSLDYLDGLRNKDGETLLTLAIDHNAHAIVLLLGSWGLSKNTPNTKGTPPLLLAATTQNINILKALVYTEAGIKDSNLNISVSSNQKEFAYSILVKNRFLFRHLSGDAQQLLHDINPLGFLDMPILDTQLPALRPLQITVQFPQLPQSWDAAVNPDSGSEGDDDEDDNMPPTTGNRMNDIDD